MRLIFYVFTLSDFPITNNVLISFSIPIIFYTIEIREKDILRMIYYFYLFLTNETHNDYFRFYVCIRTFEKDNNTFVHNLHIHEETFTPEYLQKNQTVNPYLLRDISPLGTR